MPFATLPLHTKTLSAQTDPTATQADPIVGMWRCDYSALKSVFFFNEDGTFISLSVVLGHNTYGLPYYTIELFKGNYQMIEGKIKAANVFRYTNDPSDGGKGGAEGTTIAVNSLTSIHQILLTGSKSEVLELLDLNHDLYRLKGREWASFGDRDGDFVFHDVDNIQFRLFGGNNEYKRVKE